MKSVETSTQACRVLPAGATYAGKQGFNYFAGLSAQTVGSHGICMHLLTIPPGGRAHAHKHESHEQESVVLLPELEAYVPERSDD